MQPDGFTATGDHERLSLECENGDLLYGVFCDILLSMLLLCVFVLRQQICPFLYNSFVDIRGCRGKTVRKEKFLD